MGRPVSPVTMFADRRIVVTVGGTLDLTTAPDLEPLVSDNLTAAPDVLVLELAGVTGCDEAAVASLQRVQQMCALQSVLLHVVPSAAVREAVAAVPAVRDLLPRDR